MTRSMAASGPLPPAIAWRGGSQGSLLLLDQTRLPHDVVVLEMRHAGEVASAIERLCVRGAPAIGIAAAYGLVLGARAAVRAEPMAFAAALQETATLLRRTRPTAVNLGAALDRMLARAAREPHLDALFDEAQALHREDQESCRRMGEYGQGLVPEGATVLTHCNTGRLATAGDGTALAILFAAFRKGRRFQVLSGETRPLLQGARLTALELQREGIPVEVIADSAGPGLIARGQVQLVLAGADRIARNGDVANKVGTYPLALAAHAHGVPMWIAAPATTFDLSLADGRAIPIEDRDPDEVLTWRGQRLAAPGVGARNPAFDVTPARLLTGLCTDHGLIQPVSAAGIKAALASGR
jgi:methylthioribose-1-phosphate isomerase